MLERNGSTAQIKLAAQFFSTNYFQKWAGEIAPILVKIKGLLAMLVLNISNYSYLALAPFMVVQQTTCLIQKTTLNQNSQIPLSL
jgi:hypothetical protein